MARSRFRRTFRRRRRRSETYTTIQCFGCLNLYSAYTCSSPLIDVFMVAGMSLPRSPADVTQVTNAGARFLVVDGIRFQAEYTHDPSESLSCPSCDPFSTAVAFNLRIWEALVVLPLNQGTTNVPAYLPNLTTALGQTDDQADRVLWKRITIMPIWGLNTTGGVPQLETTIRDMGHGPVAVKSKVRLDDRHALFYVRNYVHDLALTPGQSSNCTVNCTTGPTCSIPIQHDMWFKTFYHTR